MAFPMARITYILFKIETRNRLEMEETCSAILNLPEERSSLQASRIVFSSGRISLTSSSNRNRNIIHSSRCVSLGMVII